MRREVGEGGEAPALCARRSGGRRVGPPPPPGGLRRGRLACGQRAVPGATWPGGAARLGERAKVRRLGWPRAGFSLVPEAVAAGREEEAPPAEAAAGGAERGGGGCGAVCPAAACEEEEEEERESPVPPAAPRAGVRVTEP